MRPAGWFVRGSLSGESDARPDETPQGLIFVDAFYLDRHPVPNLEYERLVAAPGHRPLAHWRYGHAPVGMAQHPVTFIDWPLAPSARWLRGITGQPELERLRLANQRELLSVA